MGISRYLHVQIWVLFAAVFIPVYLLCFLLYSSFQSEQSFAQLELNGVLYQKPIASLLKEITNYQALLIQTQAGNKNVADGLMNHLHPIDRLFDELLALDGRFGANLETGAAALAADGNPQLSPLRLRQKWEQMKATPYSAADYISITDNLAKLSLYVGQTSNLILDPTLASYSLVDSAIINIPKALLKTHSLRSTLLQFSLENKKDLLQNDLASIYGEKKVLSDVYFTNINTATRTAVRATKQMDTKTQAAEKSLLAALNHYNTAAKNMFTATEITHQGKLKNAKNALKSTNGAIDSAEQLSIITFNLLEQLLHTRISMIEQKIYTAFTTCGIAISVSFSLLLLITRQNRHRLSNGAARTRASSDNNVIPYVPAHNARGL